MGYGDVAHAQNAMKVVVFAAMLATASGAAPSTPDVPAVQATIERQAASATGSTRDLLLGMLAARRGESAESDRRLTGYLAKVGAVRAVPAAFRYLAWNAALAGDYARATTFGDMFLAHLQPRTSYEASAFEDELQFWRAFAGQPAMTVSTGALADIPMHANRSGRPEAVVAADGQPALALFDTGAEQSVISLSLAQRLQLTLLPATLSDAGAAGTVNTAHAALLPKLRLGDVLARDVPVEVLDDDQLAVGPADARERLDMIVGYAVLRRAGTVTFRPGRSIAFGTVPRGTTATADLLEEGFQPLLRARVLHRDAALLVDTGASATVLNADFYQQHRHRLKDLAPQTFTMTGIGGSAGTPSLRLPKLAFHLRAAAVTLTDVRVLPGPSQFDVPGTIGNLGRDAFAGFDSVTIDFSRRRLLLAPVSEPAG